MSLTEYRRKRNFRVTREPLGGALTRRKHEGIFVVQKHAASHLHYDFRLELDGVLKSWAVPKGPSINPNQKRLAIQVEDHPIEYGTFEGIIPQGEYGGGTVMLWDRGTWTAVEDGRKGFKDGRLKFSLHGSKLNGDWMLVRKGGRNSSSDKRHWILFKARDEYSDDDLDIATSKPLSVVSGRDLDEISMQGDRVWSKKGEVKVRRKKQVTNTMNAEATNPKRSSAKPTATEKSVERRLAQALRVVNGKKARFPDNASVELATLAKEPPGGDEWIHEIKFDGYRMLCHLRSGKARFVSRNGKDWTDRFFNLKAEAEALHTKNALLDGEVVILDANGRSSFQAIQNAFRTGDQSPFLFYVFDLLYLDGFDLRHRPIEQRKRVLQALIPPNSPSPIQFSDHAIGNGAQLFAEATRLKLEGIVSKRLGSPYSAGRGLDWLKIKCAMREEFVIGGFTKPSRGRKYFGALALGYYDPTGLLKYAGRVGTGFTDQSLADLRTQFEPLIQIHSPFEDLKGRSGQAKDVTWLKPTLVAQVAFSNWTGDKQLRHPSFEGLREDKPAKSVVRDDSNSNTGLASAQSATKSTKGRTSNRLSGNSDDNTVAGITLTHPDKLLYPDDGITKLDLANYYEQVAPWMLPHVKGRLLSLVRCPAGTGSKCFFQKHPGESEPDVLHRYLVKESKKTEEYLAVKNPAGLIALVQMGVLEIHIWGSKADQYQKPDRLVFDLDPDPSVSWIEVVTAAKEVKLLLEELNLVSFIKTTGGKGLHVVLPVQRRNTWDEAKSFCRAVADFMVRAAPDRYIAQMSKAARKNKIFIDYLRNDEGATAIAPYSTRNKTGATVSVPLAWDELSARITSDHFNIRNVPARLARLKKDPWSGIDHIRQSITAKMLAALTQ